MSGRKGLVIALAVGVFFSLGACQQKDSAKSQVPGTAAAQVAPPTAVNDTFWIDVRTPAEFQDGHLAAASNIPLQVIGEQFASQVPDHNATIALYCRSGHRAGQALSILQGMGYTRAFNAGGYADLKRIHP